QEAGAHVVPPVVVALLLRSGTNGADQPGATRRFERKHRGEIALVDRHVELTVDHRTARLDVGDVEQMLVRSAREGDAEVLADGRARAVAAGEECGAAGRSLQLRLYAIARLLEAEELHPALHLDA